MKGIGRSFSLSINRSAHLKHSFWVTGTAYEYGMLPPRYPMPAIREYAQLTEVGYAIWLFERANY